MKTAIMSHVIDNKCMRQMRDKIRSIMKHDENW